MIPVVFQGMELMILVEPISPWRVLIPWVRKRSPGFIDNLHYITISPTNPAINQHFEPGSVEWWRDDDPCGSFVKEFIMTDEFIRPLIVYPRGGGEEMEIEFCSN
jgi:hypothetical protein